MQILGTKDSVEREMGSSPALPHLHAHCAQKGLGEGVEEAARLLNHQTGDSLRSSLAPWQRVCERRWGAGGHSRGAAALAVEIPG